MYCIFQFYLQKENNIELYLSILIDSNNYCFSYFSTNQGVPGRNGFPGDSRLVGGFKTGTATPFVGLMAPLSGTPAPPTSGATAGNMPSGANMKDSNNDSKTSPAEAPTFPPFGPNPFVQPGVPPLFPPMIDMSSTQALLNMVRSASAHSANQLETYLKVRYFRFFLCLCWQYCWISIICRMVPTDFHKVILWFMSVGNLLGAENNENLTVHELMSGSYTSLAR